MRFAIAIVALLGLAASQASAAEVTFRGTINSYTQFLGVADPLGISPGAPGTFVGWLNTNATTVVSGGISFQTTPNRNFLFSGGTLATAPGTTTFSNMVLAGVPGVTMTFSFAQQIPDFVSQNSINQLLFAAGGTTITVNGGGNAGFYTGSVQFVPEPSSALALLSLVSGGGLWGWRRRRQMVAA